MAMGLLCISDSAWLFLCPQPDSWRPQWVSDNPLYMLEALTQPYLPTAAHNMLPDLLGKISIVGDSLLNPQSISLTLCIVNQQVHNLTTYKLFYCLVSYTYEVGFIHALPSSL